ncbi:MAG: hypothetical protein IH571_02710, partial [Acholeplasmataceae bacterium]|nr:hypothetical protein [Acholeplasmataceae bacterium]
MKKIIKIVLLIPLILVGLFLLVYARLSLIRNNDIRLQSKYMTQQL